MRLELEVTQHFLSTFRSPMPFLAALVVLCSVPVIARVSSASLLPTMRRCQWKAVPTSGTSDSVPRLRSLFNMLVRAFNTACLRVRLCLKVVPTRWRRLFHPGRGRHDGDDTYATPEAEARYWRVADRYRRRLYSGNSATSAPSKISTASRESMTVPLVTYYTPRLLPLYRDQRTSRDNEVDVHGGRISLKTFCKWHRMVFQDSCHPTFAQAATQIKYYSNRDLREIRRISRLLPDEQVFGRTGKRTRKEKITARYGTMWQSWLENKGADLVVVFE